MPRSPLHHVVQKCKTYQRTVAALAALSWLTMWRGGPGACSVMLHLVLCFFFCMNEYAGPGHMQLHGGGSGLDTHLYHDVGHQRLRAIGRRSGQVGGPFERHQCGGVQTAGQSATGGQVVAQAVGGQTGQLPVLGRVGLAELMPVLKRDVVDALQQQPHLVGQRRCGARVTLCQPPSKPRTGRPRNQRIDSKLLQLFTPFST